MPNIRVSRYPVHDGSTKEPKENKYKRNYLMLFRCYSSELEGEK